MTFDERMNAYRMDVRAQMRRFSDEALAYQSARIVGGIDREECDRELDRRAGVLVTPTGRGGA